LLHDMGRLVRQQPLADLGTGLVTAGRKHDFLPGRVRRSAKSHCRLRVIPFGVDPDLAEVVGEARFQYLADFRIKWPS